MGVNNAAIALSGSGCLQTHGGGKPAKFTQKWFNFRNFKVRGSTGMVTSLERLREYAYPSERHIRNHPLRKSIQSFLDIWGKDYTHIPIKQEPSTPRQTILNFEAAAIKPPGHVECRPATGGQGGANSSALVYEVLSDGDKPRLQTVTVDRIVAQPSPAAQDCPALPPGLAWHNPLRLTPTEVGVADGWRLLLQDEHTAAVADIECHRLGGRWFACGSRFDSVREEGAVAGNYDRCGTFRTRHGLPFALMQAAACLPQGCPGFVEDPAVCDSQGEPKGQCAECGGKEAEHAPAAIQDFPPAPEGREWHNPGGSNFSPERVGVSDGWRLLLKEEIVQKGDESWYGGWQSIKPPWFGQRVGLGCTCRTRRPLPAPQAAVEMPATQPATETTLTVIPAASSHQAGQIVNVQASMPTAQPGVRVFAFDGHPVRTGGEPGNPWVCVLDVLRALDDEPYEGKKYNVNEALKGLDAEEFILTELFDPNGKQRDTACVYESGLYFLIGKSRKASARKFQAWVRKEVLPAVNKTGAYVAPGAQLAAQAAAGGGLSLATVVTIVRETVQPLAAEFRQLVVDVRKEVTDMRQRTQLDVGWLLQRQTSTESELTRQIGVRLPDLAPPLRLQDVECPARPELRFLDEPYMTVSGFSASHCGGILPCPATVFGKKVVGGVARRTCQKPPAKPEA